MVELNPRLTIIILQLIQLVSELSLSVGELSIYLSISIYCHTSSRTFLAGVRCRGRLAEKKKIKAK